MPRLSALQNTLLELRPKIASGTGGHAEARNKDDGSAPTSQLRSTAHLPVSRVIVHNRGVPTHSPPWRAINAGLRSPLQPPWQKLSACREEGVRWKKGDDDASRST